MCAFAYTHVTTTTTTTEFSKTFDPAAIESFMMRRSITMPNWLSNLARGSPFVDDSDRLYHQESPTTIEAGDNMEMPLKHKGLSASDGSIGRVMSEPLRVLSKFRASSSAPALMTSSSVPNDVDLSKYIEINEKRKLADGIKVIEKPSTVVRSKPIEIAAGRERTRKDVDTAASSFGSPNFDKMDGFDVPLPNPPRSRKSRATDEKGWKKRFLKPRDLNMLAPCSL